MQPSQLNKDRVRLCRVAGALLLAACLPLAGAQEAAPRSVPPTGGGEKAPATKAAAPQAGQPSGRAGAMSWRSFSPGAFRRAQAEDKLILLVLDVPWSEFCSRAEREVWSDPAVRRAIHADFVAVRERADLRPDLTRRYPAEGWPAVSVLLPNGSPLQMIAQETGQPRRVTTGFRDAASMTRFLGAVAGWYSARRSEAIALAKKQEEAIAASIPPKRGAVGEALVWAVTSQLEAGFDKEHRYFGGPPRLPRFDLIELMLTAGVAHREENLSIIGNAALDTLWNNLWLREGGGLQRMALGLDWENPQPERLLDRNARLLELFTLRYRLTAKRSDAERVREVARYLIDAFGLEDGSFAAGVCEPCDGGRDTTVLTAANALASAALLRAGAVLGDEKLISRAMAGMEFLRLKRWRAGRGVPTAVVDGFGTPPGNLVLDDLAETCLAFELAWEATADAKWLEAARDVARTALANLRDGETGALRDVIPAPSGPLPLRRSLFPIHSNSRMVRALVRLHYQSRQDRTWLAAARDILRAFGGSYDRVGLFLPAYALAAYEFYLPPQIAVVVARPGAEGADALRRAAIDSAFPFTIVKTMNPASEQQDIVAAGMSIGARPGLYGFFDGLGSRRVERADAVRAALHDLRLKREEQERMRRQGEAK